MTFLCKILPKFYAFFLKGDRIMFASEEGKQQINQIFIHLRQSCYWNPKKKTQQIKCICFSIFFFLIKQNDFVATGGAYFNEIHVLELFQKDGACFGHYISCLIWSHGYTKLCTRFVCGFYKVIFKIISHTSSAFSRVVCTYFSFLGGYNVISNTTQALESLEFL